MEKDIYSFQKRNKPSYYQKNKGKISHIKKSLDYKIDSSIKNIYNNNDNTDIIESYKRTQRPLPNNLNLNLPFKLYKYNNSFDKINFNFKNISSKFNINLIINIIIFFFNIFFFIKINIILKRFFNFSNFDYI